MGCEIESGQGICKVVSSLKNQGDRIGRIFAFLMIVYFSFFFNYKSRQNF
jgi:hypothetical protein